MGIYIDYLQAIAAKQQWNNTQDPILYYLDKLGIKSMVRPFDTTTLKTEQTHGPIVAKALAEAAIAIAYLDRETTFPISDKQIQQIVYYYWAYSDKVTQDIQQHIRQKNLTLTDTQLNGVTEATRNFIFNCLHSIVKSKMADGRETVNYAKMILYNDILTKLVPRPHEITDHLDDLVKLIHAEEIAYMKEKFLFSSMDKFLTTMHVFGARHCFNLIDEIAKSDPTIIEKITQQISNFKVAMDSPQAKQLIIFSNALNAYKDHHKLDEHMIATIDNAFGNASVTARRNPNDQWVASRSYSRAQPHTPALDSSKPGTRNTLESATMMTKPTSNSSAARPGRRRTAAFSMMYTNKAESAGDNIEILSEQDITAIIANLNKLLEEVWEPALQCKFLGTSAIKPPEEFNILAEQVLAIREAYKNKLSNNNFIYALNELEKVLCECNNHSKLKPVTDVIRAGLNVTLSKYLQGANTHRMVINKFAEAFDIPITKAKIDKPTLQK